jgi:hypothetical protein
MKKKIIILLISISALSQGMAATLAVPERMIIPADSVPDKNTVRKLLDWVTIFTMFSNVDLSDKVDLKQYAEAADLAASFITNPELSLKISTFRAASFVNVYPKGLVYSNEWLFKKLNEVSNAQYSVMNAPYVNMEVLFTPANNGTSYMVTIVFKGSPEIKESLTDANKAASDVLHGEQFSRPREGKEKINAAIFAGLDKLQEILGSAYTPNIAIKYDEELYLNNQTLEAWQKPGGAITLEAVDKNGTPLTGSLTWTNAIGNGNTIEYKVDEASTTKVTVKRGNDQISFNVRVKEFTLNVEDLLKEILLEVITEKIQSARESLDKVKNDSSDLARKIDETKAQLNVQSGFAAYDHITPSGEAVDEGIIDFREGTPAELEDIRKDNTKNNFIEFHRAKFLLLAQALLQIKIEVFLEDILKNDGNIEAYAKAIKDNSPQLIADLILNMIRKPENRSQVKDIVVNFLNKQIDEVVSKS